MKTKKWFKHSITCGRSGEEALEYIVGFANQHQLVPGELLFVSPYRGRDLQFHFMYYAENELEF